MLRIRKARLVSQAVNPRVRITAVRKPFDPEAFAAVLVAAALARLTEDAGECSEADRPDHPEREPDDR